MKKYLFSLILAALAGARVFAYGPQGHEMVGKVAEVLLSGSPTETKLAAELDGIPLGLAAKLPDAIKSWDAATPDGKDHPDLDELGKYPAIEEQLREFHDANMETTPENPGEVMHRQFHFVDVPVKVPHAYADGTVGRSDHDLVHMITYCIKVLKGTIPQPNDRKITRAVAIILLCHYLGDIHQPLHVGAEYFGDTGAKADPDAHETAYADRGGNNLSIGLITGVPQAAKKNSRYAPELHGLWDSNFVLEAFKEIRAGRRGLDIAQYYASHEPADWKLKPSVKIEDWSTAWANEILPLAREAHERLDFADIKLSPDKQGIKEAYGTVSDSAGGYKAWASGVVKDEIGKAGWRLAEVLRETVK